MNLTIIRINKRSKDLYIVDIFITTQAIKKFKSTQIYIYK